MSAAGPMRKILTLTMSGLVTVLPLALTVYVIWWMVHTVEGWLRRALIALKIVSPEHYWPGLGLIAGFLLLLAVGSLVNAYAGKILLKYWDDFLGRIPFVKTLYGGFRDVVSLLPSGSGEKRDLQRVVLARFAGVHAIGFVTREDAPDVLVAHGGRDLVTVYFPMSYAFGGYTVYLPRELVQPLDISVEDAMRLAITAGLTAAGHRGRNRRGARTLNSFPGSCPGLPAAGLRGNPQSLSSLLGSGIVALRKCSAGRPGGPDQVSGLEGGGGASLDRPPAMRSSLATAAALFVFVGPSQKLKMDSAAGKSASVQLAARASELDPENPSIAWLRLELCAATLACDIREAATTMRWVDADNGAVWMATLAAAEKDRESVDVDRVLQDMAQGSRFDLYFNRTVVLVFDSLKQVAAALPAGYVPSDLSRLSEAIAIAGAEVVPPFAPLLAACRESSAAERRDNCLKLSKTMQHGDAVVTQMAGFTLERRLTAPDGKEARSIAERRRVLEWRIATASQNDVPLFPWSTNAFARARIAQMRTAPREEDVDIAILRKLRLPLEPPEGHP